MPDPDPTPVPRLLDYPSPPLSPYDRPIEPFVTFARRFKRAIRICYLIGVILLIGFLVWGAFRMAGALDRYSP
jgi:hypothetical protein